MRRSNTAPSATGSHFTAAEIAALNGNPTAPHTPLREDRTATAQIEALLKVTNRQVYDIENAAALGKDEFRMLAFLADVLSTLVRAQRDAAKVDGEGFDAEKVARERVEHG